MRIVREMREHDKLTGRSADLVRPRYMVFENVPGLLSSGTAEDENGEQFKGEDFRIVLEEIAKVSEPTAVIPRPNKWRNAGCIVGNGWSCAWKIHDSQFWGVPQRRRRICVLCDFNGYTAADILFDPQLRREAQRTEQDTTDADSGAEPRSALQTQPESMSGDLEQSAEETEETAGRTGESTAGAGNDAIPIEGNGQRGSHRGNGYGNPGDPMFTLNGTEHHAVAYGICAYDSNAFKSPNPNSAIYLAETSRTLDPNGGSPACNQGGVAIVDYPCGASATVYESHDQDSRYRTLGDVCETISAKYGTGGGNAPMVLEHECRMEESI